MDEKLIQTVVAEELQTHPENIGISMSCNLIIIAATFTIHVDQRTAIQDAIRNLERRNAGGSRMVKFI